ncbi:hypothetical protein JW964_10645, partial [candidate division KSB1 bacterium]|nr:hypothetical protein [candidate division KSB1 bacterium]
KEPVYVPLSEAVRQLAQFNQSGNSMALIKRIVNEKDTLYQIIVLPDVKIPDKPSPFDQVRPISRK